MVTAEYRMAEAEQPVGELTDAEYAMVRDWLTSKGAPKTCEACGQSGTWVLNRDTVMLPARGGPAKGLRMVVTYCNNCANIRMHVAVHAGLKP